MKKERITNLAWIFGIFLILAAFFASETYVWYWVKGKPPAFWTYFRFNMARWYPWAFLTPLIIRMVRKRPFNVNFWPVSFVLHVALNGFCALVVALVYAITKAGWSVLSCCAYSEILNAFINLLHYNILAYWLIAVITYLADKLRHNRENELRIMELQAGLSQAQYRFLARQIRPHFLFNTMHALSALIHIDIKRADFLIGRLSDFLRRALDDGGPMVPLEREFEILRIFTDIEKIRFGDDFDAQVEADARCLANLIPNMMLQPLLEVLMGQEGVAMTLLIKADCQGDSVSIIMTRLGENGPSETELENQLQDFRQRLQRAYADRHKLDVSYEQPNELSIRLEIPKIES